MARPFGRAIVNIARYHLRVVIRVTDPGRNHVQDTRRCFCCPHALITSALAASPADILAANKAAMGNWNGKTTLKVEYAYSGQGLTGTTSSLEDLQLGAFVDTYDIGPASGASGFDGAKAWEKETSGTVTDQAGGDVVPLAISEAYQDRNLWWRADRGGAKVEDLGQKTDKDGKTYDVLKVTPNGGTAIEAWFDPTTHLSASHRRGSIDARRSRRLFGLRAGGRRDDREEIRGR